MSEDYAGGWAVTVARHEGAWQVREYEDKFWDVGASLSAVRALRNEGPAFAMLNVEDDYLVVLRPGPARALVLLSDATMAVDDEFAEEVLGEAGLDAPEIDPDELDMVDAWADGDFDIFADLGLSNEQLSVLLDEDADPEDLAFMLADELGFGDELADALGDDD